MSKKKNNEKETGKICLKNERKTARTSCKECPWTVRTQHNDKMISNIERLVENGSLKTKQHRCHMIDHNLWSAVNDDNVCIGSLIIKE